MAARDKRESPVSLNIERTESTEKEEALNDFSFRIFEYLKVSFALEYLSVAST